MKNVQRRVPAVRVTSELVVLKTYKCDRPRADKLQRAEGTVSALWETDSGKVIASVFAAPGTRT